MKLAIKGHPERGKEVIEFIHLDGIVKAYQINKPGALHKTFTNDTHLTLVWEKPKETELTMQQIADKFGIDVNQLKIKK